MLLSFIYALNILKTFTKPLQLIRCVNFRIQLWPPYFDLWNIAFGVSNMPSFVASSYQACCSSFGSCGSLSQIFEYTFRISGLRVKNMYQLLLFFKNRSPAWCPCASFTSLKLSKSIYKTAPNCLVCRAKSSCFSSASMRTRLFGSPVNTS